MRHLKEGKKFHRKTGARRALLEGLAAHLIMKQKMHTTEAKAKTTRSRVERYVTIAKRGRVHDLRLLLAHLPKKAATKLFYDIAPRCKDRRGGYTRVVKIGGTRKRDAARMARVEFVDL